MENKTLRELYDYDLIPDDEMSYPTDEWFNVLMDKTEEQLTLTDICRMLRQKIFSVVAIRRAIELLNDDPFTGDLYDGQLLCNLSNAKEKYLSPHYGEAERILDRAAELVPSHEWSTDSDREEFIKIAENFRKRIKEAQK